MLEGESNFEEPQEPEEGFEVKKEKPQLRTIWGSQNQFTAGDIVFYMPRDGEFHEAEILARPSREVYVDRQPFMSEDIENEIDQRKFIANLVPIAFRDPERNPDHEGNADFIIVDEETLFTNKG